LFEARSMDVVRGAPELAFYPGGRATIGGWLLVCRRVLLGRGW
jgi:hypothetical protein